MNLSMLIEEIRSNLGNRDAYSSYILKDLKVLEENEKDVKLYPIIDFEIDLKEKEITFLSSERNEDPKKQFTPIRLGELLAKLEKIDPRYWEFQLFSGSSIFKLDDEYYGRRDTPLAAYGFNDDEKVFVMIQSPSEDP